MNMNLSRQESSALNSSMLDEDSFDEYLFNSDLSVPNMIKQVKEFYFFTTSSFSYAIV